MLVKSAGGCKPNRWSGRYPLQHADALSGVQPGCRRMGLSSKRLACVSGRWRPTSARADAAIDPRRRSVVRRERGTPRAYAACVQGASMLEDLTRDVIYGVRIARRNPG